MLVPDMSRRETIRRWVCLFHITRLSGGRNLGHFVCWKCLDHSLHLLFASHCFFVTYEVLYQQHPSTFHRIKNRRISVFHPLLHPLILSPTLAAELQHTSTTSLVTFKILYEKKR